VRGRDALVTGLVFALLAAAPAAHAACADEQVVTAHAARSANALAIGDSTMVYSVPYFAKLGIDANARACRNWDEGLALMRSLRRRGHLPSLVVMALGANSWVRPIDVQRALKVIGPKRRLGLVTHRTWFGKPGPDTGVIRKMARKYRKRTVLMDWVKYAQPHESWFNNAGYDDGLHPNKLGARKFASFIAGYAK
jgi:hypothetical protein